MAREKLNVTMLFFLFENILTFAPKNKKRETTTPS